VGDYRIIYTISDVLLLSAFKAFGIGAKRIGRKAKGALVSESALHI
jgi:hypothetical protein